MAKRFIVVFVARTTLETLCHLEKCAWDETNLRMEPSSTLGSMRGVFVGKFDRCTDEFLLLTPTGALKTRWVRRLEGDNAWQLQVLNFCVGGAWNATARARSRGQRSNESVSWQVVDVRKECTCDRTFWTSTDVLQDAQVVLESGSTQRSAEQELNKKWWTKVMQLSLTHVGIRKKLCQNLMSV